MTKVIYENERGLLFKDGKFIDVLYSGKHNFFRNCYSVIVVKVDEEFKIKDFDIEPLLKNEKLHKDLSIIEVPDESITLHYINGNFKECLTKGKFAFWNVYQKHTFVTVSIKDAEVSEEVPKYIFNEIPTNLYKKVLVQDYEKARLYYDGKFVKLLDEGTYYFWNNGTQISADYVDTRLLQMNMQGQEMLTLDKVGLRINFVCNYKITDYIKIHSEIEDVTNQIYVSLQLALREYIGKYRLDEILENKDKISEYMYAKLKEKEESFFVEVYDIGIKDIILPGEIRDIMNTVLIAEKKAQANVITRREEVASTRSLLNTAKLMDENKTLYKLKELEYLEKICEKVGNINVSNSNDLLSELTRIMKG